MDRSRILAIAGGVLTVGVLAAGPAAAAERTEQTEGASYAVQASGDRSAAGGDLVVNKFPCCV
ncbi:MULTISPECIES: hypothetical protein [unclassified Streptomyces]|uniref:hypothetical protein n=1 Tax=unclassified Streptomyces TaxID=2593676 RepID=UPI000F6D13EE|nr:MULTISPECIES: hypothetical protein [unclassified Streptomyces]AZM93854.1 hypothetical protein D1J60_35670 [Streptomyces sp. W1SF4]RSS64105.1 hypothetical protein EF912_02295 [Streptomyces sp. WAC07061]